jgi:hypothetical protein
MTEGAPAAPTAAPASTQEDRGGSGPIIVTAEMAPEDQAWADRQRARFYPVERNAVGAHITLFHHLPPGCLGELKQLLGRISGQSVPAARIDRLLAFGQGVAYHVESPGLLAIYEELAERFAGLLTPQDSVRPQLHITIQNKVVPGEARSTLAELQAGFSPRHIAIRGIGVWRYRGGPWSPIARYAFRH